MTTMNMQLQHDQFMLIENKLKTIEVRLNDAKRRRLTVGDTIVFTDLRTHRQLTTQVTSLDQFTTFRALFNRYSSLQVGSGPQTSVAQMVHDMHTLYSPAQERRLGVLAIGIAPR